MTLSNIRLTRSGRSLSQPIGVWIGIALLVALNSLRPSLAAPALRHAAVATEAGPATDAALAQLRAGGNAIDAAVTAALVGGVVNSSSSGIGGGGFALVWSAKDKKAIVLDFRETAPAKIDAAAFERRPFPPAARGNWVGVPGEVAGLHQLHSRFGRRSWRDVVDPAARIARRGFGLGTHMARVAQFMGQRLNVEPRLAKNLLPGGRPAPAGRWIKNPELALTLERIRDFGPRAFYDSPIAVDLAYHVRKYGGSMTLEDLQHYRPIERLPLSVKWEGHQVFTMPPPSAGGLMLAQTLKLYSKSELQPLGADSAALAHLLAEAMRGALADRMRFIGDPSFERFDRARLLGDAHLKARKKSIAADKTQGLARFAHPEHGTHHLVSSDAEGNVVSLTTTVNRPFGANIVTSAGIVLNDELDDFTQQKWVAPLGIKQSPNRPRPGARPVSSMTPTIIVKDGRAVFALGGSGGMAIATNVTQTTVMRLAFHLPPEQLVQRLRFGIPLGKGSIELDANAPKSFVQDLESRGENVVTRKMDLSAVQLLALEPTVSAAADPRKSGKAGTATQ